MQVDASEIVSMNGVKQVRVDPWPAAAFLNVAEWIGKMGTA